MAKMVTKGVFSGNVNGSELNIESITEVTPTSYIVEHRGIGTKSGVRDEITDPGTVRTLTYLELRRATQAKAEAHRMREVTPIWKPKKTKSVRASSNYCPDCDGSGWYDGDECPACDGDGWRMV